MQEPISLQKLSPHEKTRLAYIEGQDDLFETKLLSIVTNPEAHTDKKPNKKILILSRDPGSANALLPVMEYLYRSYPYEMSLLTDGRAQEIFQKKFTTQEIKLQSSLEADKAMDAPDIILTDPSLEQGLETYAAATFNDVPMVLVEDYYTSAHSFLAALKNRNIPFPKKICVMDQVAQELLVEKFPELKNEINITGQPAFDRFFNEDTEQIEQEVKTKLGLRHQDVLVSFMATLDVVALSKGLAHELHKIGTENFSFAFRRHPRDNVPFDEYQKIFKENNIKALDTRSHPTNDIGAASNLIITTWSTEGLHGIYRRKPTIHIIDKSFLQIPEGLILPIPPVKLGASIGIDNVHETSQQIEALLQKDSMTNKNLKINMDKYYPSDGKNTERVVQSINDILQSY